MQLNLSPKTTCLERPYFYGRWGGLSRHVPLCKKSPSRLISTGHLNKAFTVSHRMSQLFVPHYLIHTIHQGICHCLQLKTVFLWHRPLKWGAKYKVPSKLDSRCSSHNGCSTYILVSAKYQCQEPEPKTELKIFKKMYSCPYLQGNFRNNTKLGSKYLGCIWCFPH